MKIKGKKLHGRTVDKQIQIMKREEGINKMMRIYTHPSMITAVISNTTDFKAHWEEISSYWISNALIHILPFMC